MLPQPKRWRAESDLLVVPRNVKIHRPVRLSRSGQAEQVRMLDRAIAAFSGRLAGGSPPTQTRKSIKSIDLSIVDELGDGLGSLIGSEAYRLVIGPDAVALSGLDAPALRAGLVSLTRLLQVRDGVSVLPGGQMTDWPDLPLRGFHLDLSCQSLRYDYVCGLLERLAGYKFNAVLLEWGDKFPYQGHQVLSHPDAFTPRQVAQLLELCEGLGLVVIPLVQTLGHVEFILRHPQFAHLSEVPGEIYQLATANPESLVLSKQLVDQLIESHPNSPYIHLGADEAVQLGQGVSADEVRRKGKSLAWVEYMNVICRHVQARGRTPIVWDDMLLGHPQALNRFTRDCLLMHWNYAATAAVSSDYLQPGLGRINARTYARLDAEIRERYEPFWAMGGARPPKTFYTPAPVAYLCEAGFGVILAPAVRSCGDSYSAPRLRQHQANCVHMAQAAAEHRCLGLLATNWSVRRTPLESTVPGLIVAAEAAWNTPDRPSRDLEARLAEDLSAGSRADLIGAMERVSRSGNALFNGVGPGSAWDRRHQRWGVAPLLGRIRRADLGALTASSEPVKLARQVRSAAGLLARVSPAAAHPLVLPTWRLAARETAYKASQWLFFWEVSRLVRVDRGAVATLAAQGAALLEDIRRCQREFKRTVGPTLTPDGLAEELDIHFGQEARLLRRIVRALRAKTSRIETRHQLAAILGLSAATAPAGRQSAALE